MLRATRMKNKAKNLREAPHARFQGKPDTRGPTEFPGIVEDAKALGVSRTHLWRVLTGQRESARLLARYQHLKAQQRPGEDTPAFN